MQAKQKECQSLEITGIVKGGLATVDLYLAENPGAGGRSDLEITDADAGIDEDDRGKSLKTTGIVKGHHAELVGDIAYETGVEDGSHLGITFSEENKMRSSFGTSGSTTGRVAGLMFMVGGGTTVEPDRLDCRAAEEPPSTQLSKITGAAESE
jgi:hypothetical protein